MIRLSFSSRFQLYQSVNKFVIYEIISVNRKHIDVTVGHYALLSLTTREDSPIKKFIS